MYPRVSSRDESQILGCQSSKPGHLNLSCEAYVDRAQHILQLPHHPEHPFCTATDSTTHLYNCFEDYPRLSPLKTSGSGVSAGYRYCYVKWWRGKLADLGVACRHASAASHSIDRSGTRQTTSLYISLTCGDETCCTSAKHAVARVAFVLAATGSQATVHRRTLDAMRMSKLSSQLYHEPTHGLP